MYPEGWIAEHHVDETVTLLQYADGLDPQQFRVRHACARWADDQEPDGELVKVIAPRLSAGHVVTVGDGGLTVRASISCPACGLHGFVTDGVWAAC